MKMKAILALFAMAVVPAALAATQVVARESDSGWTARAGVWKIESRELPVPGEPARVFTLTVCNCGDSPANIVLRGKV